jgi:hypothetical protein
MIKTHNKTNLKYLCKKSTDNITSCYSYRGSGTYWKKHLAKHGYDITTEIIEECDSRQQLTERGIYWSKKLNVVNSPEFANLVEERGDGGPTMLGRQITREQKIKQGKAISKFYHNASQEYKKVKRDLNSLVHALQNNLIYITPFGEFLSCAEASIKNNLSSGSIKKHCLDGSVNKLVDARKLGKEIYLKKTWRDLGYSVRTITQDELEFYNNLKNEYSIKLNYLKR